MTDILLNANTLPEPLLNLVHSEKVRVRESNGVITILPAEEKMDYIDELYGCCSGGDLTVSKFLEWTREDKVHEV
jgi:hypothetical protein